MFTWIKEKIQSHLEHEAAKERCGVAPFQLPRGFPLNDCCATHDRLYTALREYALAQAQTEGVDLSINPDWLDRFQEKIETYDKEFENCLHSMASGLWQKAWASLFIKIVSFSGFIVWKKGTISEQKDVRNPYRFP